MDFKQFLLNALNAGGHNQVVPFIESCGFHYDADAKKVVLTGPEFASADLTSVVPEIASQLRLWSNETGNAVDNIVVNPGGASEEISLEEYAGSALPASTGSFLEEAPADILPVENPANDSEIQPPLQSAEDITLSPDTDIAGESIRLAGLQEYFNQPKDEIAENSQPAQEEPMGGGDGSSLAALMKGVSKLFTKPVTVPAALISKQTAKLKDWRASRPGHFAEKVAETSAKLKHNLNAFKTDEYKLLEAKVQARGGWDAELSREFEQHLATGNQANNWKLITQQMDELNHYSKQAVALNKGNEQAVMEAIDSELSEISEISSKVPYKMKKGEVVETMREMSESVREFLRQLVQKLVRLITGNPQPTA